MSKPNKTTTISSSLQVSKLWPEKYQKNSVYSASQPARPGLWPFMDNQITAASKQANKLTDWTSTESHDPPYDSTIPPLPILPPRTVNWVTHKDFVELRDRREKEKSSSVFHRLASKLQPTKGMLPTHSKPKVINNIPFLQRAFIGLPEFWGK